MEDAHMGKMLEIYSYYVKHTAITFEYEVPGLEEWESGLIAKKYEFPIIVATEAERVIGYSYAGKLFPRAGYGWSVEASVYVQYQFHSRGIGKKLYSKLIEIVKIQGFNNVIGTVTVPNAKSEQLHHSLGFAKMGTLKSIGYKFNEWSDLCWYQLVINEHSQREHFPIKFKDLNQHIINEVLEKE